jgi:hypothetical protein
LGRIDLNTSSASDPGLSGLIAPMAKVYDGSFTQYVEPNGWRDFYKDTLDELHEMTGYIQGVDFKKKLGLNTFDYVKEDMVRETISTYRTLIPGVIDLAGKKDYSLGAIIEMSETAETILVGSDSEDGAGEVSFAYESIPE